ncbi:phage tail sheath subtilisin-like domain-containing protein [Hydrogenophaga electricum]|uniref:Tail sheath protein n=1 Tax=Hydrogenophaga electricum TaxID=1230953 RepID=A0ABQ6BZQ6_9BURK|nr:phage tail sheath subtilisin-like domain-containing protein [Hydrogenophaga electricum]GLS13618.1 tail sheath protein [Hydrogenophaga electricum]
MALDAFHHGTRVVELEGGVRPIQTIQTGVIGLVATAEDADAATFPLNRPVLCAGDAAMIDKAGETGTLARALSAIFEQTRPMIVIVRVGTAGEGSPTQDELVVGGYTDGMATGIKALGAAKAQLGVQPRVLGAPGLDTQVVTTAMVSLAEQSRSMVYARAVGSTKEAAATYRENFGSRELCLHWPDFKNGANTVEAGAVALGLRAKIDNVTGWHKTLSNVPVNGVTGISKDVSWLQQSMETDAGYLNNHEITALIRQEGFRFWGNRTCSDDPLFAFESFARTAHILADTMAEAHFWANDKVMSPGLVKDIIEGVNAKMREWVQYGYLIGGSAWYDPDVNTAATLSSGRIAIDYDYTPTPPLEDLMFRQRITDRYWMDFNSAILNA